MNLAETKKLLTQVAAVDNRKLSEETATAWQHILAHVPLEIAQEALTLARRDPNIQYLEPKHIVSWAKEAAFRLDRNKPKEDGILTGDPMPICRDHDTPILACDPCCHRLWKYKEMHGVRDIHEFAKKEIYV